MHNSLKICRMHSVALKTRTVISFLFLGKLRHVYFPEFLISNPLLPYCAALRLVPLCSCSFCCFFGRSYKTNIPVFQCLQELPGLFLKC